MSVGFWMTFSVLWNIKIFQLLWSFWLSLFYLNVLWKTQIPLYITADKHLSDSVHPQPGSQTLKATSTPDVLQERLTERERETGTVLNLILHFVCFLAPRSPNKTLQHILLPETLHRLNIWMISLFVWHVLNQISCFLLQEKEKLWCLFTT